MSLLKRLKTLWVLSGMEVKTNTSRDVYLKQNLMAFPDVSRTTMATIVELNHVDLFEDKPPSLYGDGHEIP